MNITKRMTVRFVVLIAMSAISINSLQICIRLRHYYTVKHSILLVIFVHIRKVNWYKSFCLQPKASTFIV